MPPADRLPTPPGDSRTSPADEARRALATGDRAAITRLVRDLGPMLRGVVRRILLRRGLALDLEEDLLQDVFVSVLKDNCAALAAWDADRGSLDVYLRQFARSRAIDQIRRLGRDIATDDEQLTVVAERRSPPVPEAAWLDEALDRYRAECTDEDWRVLLAVIEGRETAEIEAMFGLSTAAVYKRKQRLRDRLLELQQALASR